MTREKIIQGLQFTIEMFLFDPMTGAKRPKEVLNDLDKTTVDSCEGAIKLLEQEPILDKIRAEIQRLRGCSCSCSDGIIDDVEDIIDKYKVESEGKE